MNKSNKLCAMITDLHFGVKKNNNVFFKSQLRFLKNQFIPYLKENNIEYLSILGDMFDNRNSINTLIQNEIYNLFSNDFKFLKKIYVLIGNHDTYFNNSISVNSLKFLNKFDNVEIIENMNTITIYDKKILMVPWIVDHKNFIESFKQIDNNFDVCFGHFHITGFSFNKFRLCEDGLEGDVLYNTKKKFFSGHFHIRSNQDKNNGEIIYIGAPYQMTRSDINEQRGFCILDLEDMKHEYINNTESLQYIQLNYPDKFTAKSIKGNIIDVYIQFNDGYNEKKIDRYIKYIEQCEPVDKPNIFVVNNSEIDSELSIDGYNVKSLIELMKDYVNNLEIKDKEIIYNILVQLYQEAKGEI
jgi:DNA repair exonuclease SbcCD nuclease subunit